MISHGPVTIDLTDLEKLLSKNATTTTSQAKIDQDSGKFTVLLCNIKGAYEEFVQSMTDQKIILDDKQSKQQKTSIPVAAE